MILNKPGPLPWYVWITINHAPSCKSGSIAIFNGPVNVGDRYIIVLEEYGGCGYTNEAKLKRDLLEDIEATTCPNCGGEKYSYDDLCYSCEDEKEHTCQRCGGRKFSSFDDYCDDCEDDLSEEF